jgi:hypothetical protein
MRITPPGCSGVHCGMVDGNVPQYCMRCHVQAETMLIDADVPGVTVEARPCEFRALIESTAHPLHVPWGCRFPAARKPPSCR